MDNPLSTKYCCCSFCRYFSASDRYFVFTHLDGNLTQHFAVFDYKYASYKVTLCINDCIDLEY